MVSLLSDLQEIIARLVEFDIEANEMEVGESLDQLEEGVNTIGKAWCGSWIGHHSTVYFNDFTPPPAGIHFSKEWGFLLQDTELEGWKEYDYDFVVSEIKRIAGNPDISNAEKLAEKGKDLFISEKEEVLSIIESFLQGKDDKFLIRMKAEIEEIKIITSKDLIDYQRPKGTIWSRDSLAMSQGLITPPHIAILSWVYYIKTTLSLCKQLLEKTRKILSHLKRQQKEVGVRVESGNRVFIGHGNSLVWRELKDFLEVRCGLLTDEFNRIPIEGITNIARLSEMLEDAAIAFLIMTGEDEQPNGSHRARMNVIHEAGLFQGKLGFSKAIIMLEEGCEDFSNIDGLGQIRFSKDNIEASFEKVRRVLERENLLF